MNENDFIKAIECCLQENPNVCDDCPFNGKEECCLDTDLDFKLLAYALDLIKRQQAEIEQWKEEANRYQNLWCDAEKDISNARIEAQKDFAERLKDDVANIPAWGSVAAKKIDNLVKELTEGSK